MTKGDELKDLIIFGRQMNWQYQLSDFTDEALKSIQRSVDIARRELMDSLEMRDMLQLEELNNLTFGIQAALHDDIAASAQIAGKASYVEYNNILSFDGKISDTTGAAVGFTDVAVSAGQLKSMIVDTPVGGALLADWVSTSFDAALVQQFKEEFGAGVLKGESIQKLISRIPDGMNMLGREMVSLTRTYIASINNQAAGEVYKANSDIIKEEQWSAALEISGRSSGTCLTCAGMHGRKFPIDKPHPRPPIHIRCRCFMVPLTVSYRDLGLNIDELEEAAQPYTVRTPGAIGTGRRGTILEAGQFRGNFEEFLKSQPEKYSIELLGANRYRLLQEGKIRFSDLVDKDGNLVLLQKGVDGKYTGLMPSQKYTPSQITPKTVLKSEVVPKPTFSPVKNTAEAEALLKDMGVRHPILKGMPIDIANSIVDAVREAPRKAVPVSVASAKDIFKIVNKKPGRKLDTFYGVSMDAMSLQIGEKKALSFGEAGGHVIGVNSNSYKSLQAITDKKTAFQEKYRSQVGKNWSMNQEGHLVAKHEVGHIVYAKLDMAKQSEWDYVHRIWGNKGFDADMCKNKSEAFAESWAAFKGGKHERLPEHVLKFFKELE